MVHRSSVIGSDIYYRSWSAKLETDASIVTIPVGLSPNAVSVNPLTNTIYVVNSDNTVSVIDGNTNRVVATVAVGAASGISVNLLTNMIYVVNNDENTVSVINGTTNIVKDPRDKVVLTAIANIYNGYHNYGGAVKPYDKVMKICKNSVAANFNRNIDLTKECELAVLAR
jgi:YVTN family beta-propeller protein